MSEVADPFGELAKPRYRARVSVLGGDFTITTHDQALRDLALEAFGDLPSFTVAANPRRFAAHLIRSEHAPSWPRRGAPPRPKLCAGAGLLCATVDAGNFVVVDAAASRALVAVSSAMLRHRYHARYELIELAFLTLAARAQRLVPLHAACIGAGGNGVLLVGSSGAGKSTLTLHALANGLQVLAEDSAFVATASLRVMGVPSYLHLRESALRFLPPGKFRRTVERSPTIERRSGIRKLELDLRGLGASGPIVPLRLAATVFLSQRRAGRAPLREIECATAVARLRREQPYAAALPEWRSFERRVAAIPAFELRRTDHPDAGVRLLRGLL